MDVLSEVLRAVKLRGALFFNGEFSAPWCLRSARSSSAAPYLTNLLEGGPRTSTSERLIVFHFLTEGRAYARLQNGRREELTAGDIVILPHGDEHFIGNGSPERPVDSFQTFAKNLTAGLKVAHFGGGGEVTRFVCGFMACEPRLSEVFLAGLPNLLKVSVVDQPSGRWLESSVRFSVDHASESSAGSDLVLSKLAEVLFVETLRCYVNTLPSSETGWLAGVRDRVASSRRSPSLPTRRRRIPGQCRNWPAGARGYHGRVWRNASAIYSGSLRWRLAGSRSNWGRKGCRKISR